MIKIPQNNDNNIGFYCSARLDGDEIINWHMTSREIFNFIRAICPPSIGARSYIDNNEIVITKSLLLKNAPKYKCKEGVVVGLHKDGFLVKTSDSVIKISSYKYSKTIKIGSILMGGGKRLNKITPLHFNNILHTKINIYRLEHIKSMKLCA